MPKPRKRPRKPPGRCVFCNGVGLSKEHIWSDWLKNLIPLREDHGEHWAGLYHDRSSQTFQWAQLPQTRTRQGCLLQRKIRNVCERHCNNGWMSGVVDRAKPHAERMILGHQFQLEWQGMSDLAAWIAITTIMQEFANPRAQQIAPGDRRVLMATKTPPDTWSIWVARYGGHVWYPMGHYHIPIWYSKGSLPSELSPDAPLRHGLQLTTFALRELLVHVFTSTEAEMIDRYRRYIGESAKLTQLWPITADSLQWPPCSAFGDEEVDRLAFQWVRNEWGLGADY